MKLFELKVEVESQFVPEQSDPTRQSYLFAYTVRITNVGQRPAQIISRHWIIVDANNQQQEVKGLGVIGQQPLLAAGESFEYSSGCPLTTPVGSMRGTYLAVGDDGEPFRVPIDEFVLAMPRTLH